MIPGFSLVPNAHESKPRASGDDPLAKVKNDNMLQ